MVLKWKQSIRFSDNQVDALPQEVEPERCISTRRQYTNHRTTQDQKPYFCLIQIAPRHSSYIFKSDGDYTLVCGCVAGFPNAPFVLPVRQTTPSELPCSRLQIRIRGQKILISQQQSTSFQYQNNEAFEGKFCHFVKETANNRCERFTNLHPAEECVIRMMRLHRSPRKCVDDRSLVCSFKIRKAFLSASLPPFKSKTQTNGSEFLSVGTENLLTGKLVPVETHFQVFRDIKIGKGGNGEVFFGVSRSSGDPVAIKKEPKDMLHHEFRLINEICMQKPWLKYKHTSLSLKSFSNILMHSIAMDVGQASIAAPIAHHSTPGETCDYMVVELVDGGELRKHIKAEYPTGMPVDMARVYVYQIVCALVVVHSKKIVHRDLKTQNILVRFGNHFENDVLKLIDFGNSAKLSPGSTLSRNYTTCFACAPEIFEKSSKGYTHAVDIWAVGAIFYELLTGERLFKCVNTTEASKMIPAFNESMISKRLTSLRPDATDFLFLCLTKDPQRRPTALQLCTTQFLFPLHLYQLKCRVDASGLYTTYFELVDQEFPLETSMKISTDEAYFYNTDSQAFVSSLVTPGTKELVLPRFYSPTVYRTYGDGVQISNWIVEPNAGLHRANPAFDPFGIIRRVSSVDASTVASSPDQCTLSGVY